ncbi:MAG TPA: hypothetical protein VMV49_15255 [Candidatus Deferrimicrobium sp.]|nr:hypothetical protein [Candidatus Deferrimicrobium sp.]
MFILCLVDSENQIIAEDLPIKEKVSGFAKKELKILRQIDNVINALLRSEDFDFDRDLGIYYIKNIGKLDKININFDEIILEISKEMTNKLNLGYRVLYVTERTIFVSILAAPKWIKGLIEEKEFEMQILAPGFTLDNEKFHLEVVEFDSDLRDILEEIASGVLLVLYTNYSQLFD